MNFPPIWEGFSATPTELGVAYPSNVSGSKPALAPIQLGNPIDLVLAELEVEHPEVLLDPLRGDGLRDHGGAELEVPAEHDLRRRAAVAGRDFLDHGIVERLTPAVRAPRLGGDPAVGVEAAQVALPQGVGAARSG
jgi:hypothetical protein